MNDKTKQKPLLITALSSLQQSVINNPLPRDDQFVENAIKILQEAIIQIRGAQDAHRMEGRVDLDTEILNLLVGPEVFDAKRTFASVKEAVLYIEQYENPDDRLFEVLRFNYNHSEYGFARDLLYAFSRQD